MSEKANNFKRLAVRRTRNAIKQIELIGNLSSPNYEYTPEQVQKIVAVLNKSIENMQAEFGSTGEEFDLEAYLDSGNDENEQPKLKKEAKPKPKPEPEPEPESEEEEEEEENQDLDADLDADLDLD